MLNHLCLADSGRNCGVRSILYCRSNSTDSASSLFDGDETVIDLTYRASLHAGIDFPREPQLSSPRKGPPFSFGQELSAWDDKTDRKKSSRQSKGASSMASDSDILAELPKVRFAVRQ